MSDGVLAEVSGGQPVSELEVLRQLSANVVVRAEKISEDGLFTPRFLTELEIVPSATRLPLEMFLIELFRIMTGRPLAGSLQSQIKGARDAQVGEMRRLLEKLEPSLGNDRLSAAIKRLESLDIGFGVSSDFKINDTEMRNLRLGTDYLSSVTAPDVVEKILSRLPQSFRESLKDIFDPIEDVTTVRERVQTAGVILIVLGFCRDKRIRKTDDLRSLKGATSQWSDLEHIAAACGCTMFLTADKDCAKLAYALYEHFSVNTLSGFLDRSTPPGAIRVLGCHFWP